MNKHKSKKVRKDKYSGKKRIQKGKITGEEYGKVAVQMEQWEV